MTTKRRTLTTTKAERAAFRITKWIKATHEGNTKAAAAALGCDYTTLWRSARGHYERGPSSALVTLLIEHAGGSFEHWTGKDRA